MTEQQHSLVQVKTEEEWEAYHAIRSQVLFGDEYDPNLWDDRAPGNHPVLLFAGDTAVGAMRIDLVSQEGYAIMRTVAIRKEYQRQGLGRIMMTMAEDHARGHGCRSTVTISAIDAVGFYEKCGYQAFDWDPGQVDDDGKQMRKAL